MSEKTLFYWLAGLLLLTTIVDLFTALSSPVFRVAESNPLFVLTHSVVLLVFVSILLVCYFLFNLKYKVSLFGIFSFVLITLFVCYGHVVGIFFNIVATKQYVADPVFFVNLSSSFSVWDKLYFYVKVVGVSVLVPIFISLVSFFVCIKFYDARNGLRLKKIDLIQKNARKINKLCDKLLR